MASDFITNDIWPTITDAAKSTKFPVNAASAYIGLEGSKLLPLPATSRLVVDASPATVVGGQTCPAELAILKETGVRVFSAPLLHAKVYVFSDVAYVGSANISRNSAHNLQEAMLRTQNPGDLKAARKFVIQQCHTELTMADIKKLKAIYRPPKIVLPKIASKLGATLIMELTNEQGPGRETQVQPPLGVWKNYFDIELEDAQTPILRLVNLETDEIRKRPVVAHHHNFTIEIGGAELPRPAILKMQRKSTNNFSYRVFRIKDDEYAHLDWLLDNIKNPFHSLGRRWIVV